MNEIYHILKMITIEELNEIHKNWQLCHVLEIKHCSLYYAGDVSNPETWDKLYRRLNTIHNTIMNHKELYEKIILLKDVSISSFKDCMNFMLIVTTAEYVMNFKDISAEIKKARKVLYSTMFDMMFKYVAYNIYTAIFASPFGKNYRDIYVGMTPDDYAIVSKYNKEKLINAMGHRKSLIPEYSGPPKKFNIDDYVTTKIKTMNFVDHLNETVSFTQIKEVVSLYDEICTYYNNKNSDNLIKIAKKNTKWVGTISMVLNLPVGRILGR